MKSIIVLFGKPGAGKGTRLDEFLSSTKEQYDVLSVGNLLRKARKDQTELGKQAASYMDAGLLVPDSIINAIVVEYLKNAEHTIFMDGFPRTLAQAKALLDAGAMPDVVVEFYVEDELVIERSRRRIICEACGECYTTNEFKPPKVEGVCDKCGSKLIKRPDDEESVVRNRLEVFRKETYPVLGFLAENGVFVVNIDNSDAKSGKKQFFTIVNAINDETMN